MTAVTNISFALGLCSCLLTYHRSGVECSTEHLSLVFTDQLIQLTPLMLRRPPGWVSAFLQIDKLSLCLLSCQRQWCLLSHVPACARPQ